MRTGPDSLPTRAAPIRATPARAAPAHATPAHATPARAAGRSAVLTAVLAAMLAGSLAPAGAAAQEPPPAFSIDRDGWRGGAYARPDDRSFSHCAVARDDLLTGVTVVFARGADGRLRLGMVGAAAPDSAPPWPARIGVDDRPALAVPATGSGGEGFVLLLPDDGGLVESLRLGMTAVVSMDDRRWSVPLRGTNAALTALEACVDAAGALPAERIAALAPPAGPSGSPAADAPAAPEAARAEPEVGSMLAGPEGEIDRAGLTRLLTAAGFDGVAFARPSALPDNALELDHAWQLPNNVVGGLHQHARDESNEFLAFVDDYLDAVREVCPGDADVVLNSAERLRERFGLARASVECRAPEGPAYIELFLALDDTNYSAFFHEGGGDSSEAPAEATDRIERVVRQMAGL